MDKEQTTDQTDGTEDNKEPSALDDMALFNTMQDWFLADQAHSSSWRERAAENLDFAAGTGQWKKAAKERMEAEDRVPITFNITLPVIKAVAGIEVNTRHETVFLPRGIEEGDIVANEGLSAASQWMGEGCNAKHHESQAFQDLLKTGMGWCEERLDYEIEPDGKYIEERLDPLEMYWDCATTQQNLMDSRRRWRARKMNIVDARAMFKGVSDDDLNCSWPSQINGSELKAVEERRKKLDDNMKHPAKGEVTILQCQWWEREKYHRVANPFTGQVESLDDKAMSELLSKAAEYEQMSGQHVPVESVEQYRRVYKQVFIGGKILGGVKPCPRKDGFTLNCMTGEPNPTKRTWFGLIDMMKDPQMMANKWLSQATHIINTTAKGGILAEEDAFTDQREAEETYARPDAITWVKKGAIGGGKIMQKPGVGLAAPYLQLMNMAMDAMPRVTGINMELMGMRDAQQAGVLEAQRKQAAMTILATIFDSLAAFRVESGRTRLAFIQEYLADGRLIRVLGESGYKAVRLMKDRVVGEYDVIVSEAPTSPNQKEQTWAALQTVLPAFRDKITPALAMKLLEFVPGLPRQLVDGFKQVMQQESQPSPQAQAMQQIEFQGATAKVERDKAAAQKDFATAQKTLAEASLDAAQLAGQQIQNTHNTIRTVHAARKLAQDVAPDSNEYAVSPIGGGPQLPNVPVIPGR